MASFLFQYAGGWVYIILVWVVYFFIQEVYYFNLFIKIHTVSNKDNHRK